MIRPASFLDIPAILSLGEKYLGGELKETGHHTSDWDINKCANNLCESVYKEDVFLWVAVDDGEVIGFLWATTHELAPWSSLKVASDYVFYVKQSKRGGLFGLRLIKAYKEWATSQGCREIRLSLASGINEERVARMYEHLGFEPFGTVLNYKQKE